MGVVLKMGEKAGVEVGLELGVAVAVGVEVEVEVESRGGHVHAKWHDGLLAVKPCATTWSYASLGTGVLQPRCAHVS